MSHPPTGPRAPARLRLEALEDRAVPSLTYDPLTGRGHTAAGQPFHALTARAEPADGPGDLFPGGAPFDPADTFRLHSRPAASHVIYLDFDGHTTTGTAWNDEDLPAIVTPAFDANGNPAAFADAELARVQRIWQRVAEDFSPFDVDVTTEFPGAEALRNAGDGDDRWGIRVVVGGTGSWFAPVGGLALTDSFTWDQDNSCFVFAANLDGGNERLTAEAISHEVGHTLGLDHDGRTSPREEYYAGHGSGAVGWAPIMGEAYAEELSQWSKGEYLNADNREDDLAVITTRNGFGFRPDDHGDFSTTATPATLAGATQVSGSGVIERSADADVFAFTAGAGAVSIAVRPAERGPNLDVRAELYDALGTRIDVASPDDRLSAHLFTTVPAGRYFLRIEGVGRGNPLGLGYSDYGSLGQYTFVGTVPDPNPPAPLEVVGVSAVESATGLVTAVRVAFNVRPDPRSFGAGSVRVTGPAGARVPIRGYRAASWDRTTYDVLIAPQWLGGQGGVRVFVGPAVSSAAGRLLDQDGDGLPGEKEDSFAAAAYRFESPAGGPIADGGTTDFPLAIGRPLTVRDLNVRVDLAHPYVGDLRVELVSPANEVVPLFARRGGDGDDLAGTRFDDEAPRWLDGAAAPFAGVFKPDGGSLAGLIGDNAQGVWALRVTDALAGSAGQLRSWSLTLTTDSAQAGATLRAATPVNETGSAVAVRVSALELEFDRPMNPATVKPADVRVTDPAGLPVRVRSVAPVDGEATRFRVETAVWARAGVYTVRVGPAVADVYGNGLDTNGNGAFLEPADAAVGRHRIDNHVFVSRHRPLAVTAGGTTTAALAVGSPSRIGRLAVELNLAHPAVGSLRVTLVAPTGDEFVLADRRGGAGDHFVRTVFADAAGVSIADPAALPPFRGDYRPEEPLGSLNGGPARGTWRLRVEDLGSGEVGQLLSWALYVTPP